MKLRTHFQEGFTAVELLITLFIAAIFLFAGYQLYTQVTKDGANASKSATVSSLAYEKLRAAVSSVSALTGCAASNETVPTGTSTTQTITGVGDVTFKTTIDCPYSTTPGNLTDIFLIKVEATYDDGGTKKVEHATFTN